MSEDKKDARKKGLGFGYVIPKEEIEPLRYLSNTQISKKLGHSVYIVKKSLVHHGLYTGKVYDILCEQCGVMFQDFVKFKKFCSNDCKHNGQKIWNRGLTKEDSEIIKQSSKRMKGNRLGYLRERHKQEREPVKLPRLGKTITYHNKSNLEKEFALKADADPNVVDIRECDFGIPWVDEHNVKHKYWPDFIVIWKSGAKWIVEIKGRCDITALYKAGHANKWAKEAGYDYRLITTGMVHKDTWSRVFAEHRYLLLPSRKWSLMSHAVTLARLSPSFRLQVGCVIVDKTETSLLSYGYNGDEIGGSNAPGSLDPGAEGFIHAEENALLKLGDASDGVMFVTTMPCIMCAKKIINSQKIREVYYLHEYRDTSGAGLLIKHGIAVYHFQMIDDRGRSYDSKVTARKMTPGGLEDVPGYTKYPDEKDHD